MATPANLSMNQSERLPEVAELGYPLGTVVDGEGPTLETLASFRPPEVAQLRYPLGNVHEEEGLTGASAVSLPNRKVTQFGYRLGEVAEENGSTRVTQFNYRLGDVAEENGTTRAGQNGGSASAKDCETIINAETSYCIPDVDEESDASSTSFAWEFSDDESSVCPDTDNVDPSRTPSIEEPTSASEAENIEHATGNCSPCIFFARSRCLAGQDCQYCHLPHDQRAGNRRRTKEPKASRNAEDAATRTRKKVLLLLGKK